MVGEILTRVGLFRHGPLSDVLVTDVAVEIDHRRHHSLARELDARRSRRDQHVTAPSHYGEAVILDNKGRVLDGVAVARDEARSFEHRYSSRPGALASHLRESIHCQEQTRREQQTWRHILHSAHGTPFCCAQPRLFYFTTKRTKDTKYSEIIYILISSFVLFASFVVQCLLNLGLSACQRQHPFEDKPLHSIGGRSHVDIAFGVGGDLMAASQHPRALDAAGDLEHLAIDDRDFL